jgi:hypothetical protein
MRGGGAALTYRLVEHDGRRRGDIERVVPAKRDMIRRQGGAFGRGATGQYQYGQKAGSMSRCGQSVSLSAD